MIRQYPELMMVTRRLTACDDQPTHGDLQRWEDDGGAVPPDEVTRQRRQRWDRGFGDAEIPARPDQELVSA